MRKVGIITINDDNNFGNRLQNYALYSYLKKNNVNVDNIVIVSKGKRIKMVIKKILFDLKFKDVDHLKRYRFNKFTKKYINNKYYTNYNFDNKYDYYIVGSDQVWNYNFKSINLTNNLLSFSDPKNHVFISYAASFGISEIKREIEEAFKSGLKNFSYISVREMQGKEIIERFNLKKDIEVVLDPTMLLDTEEWDMIMTIPKQIKNISSKKFILNYFLGEISETRKEEINKIAEEFDCCIINILDKDDPFFSCNPSEFLWLEKNAFMVCTDSFHSSVFSIIYDTPFIVFERLQKGVTSMNSRIDTLLSKFKLENRRFRGEITEDLLQCDYTEAKKILEKEKEKSINFLKRALEIQE